MSLVIVQSAVDPISLSQAQLQCRADDDGHNDAMLTLCIAAAHSLIQTRAGLVLMGSIVDEDVTVTAGAPIALSLPTVASVSSVTYVDADSATQTLPASAYTISGKTLVATSAWPEDMTAAVVRYQSGLYLAAESIPGDAVMWMLMVIAFLFMQREQYDATDKLAEVPNGFHDSLLDTIRGTGKAKATYVFA